MAQSNLCKELADRSLVERSARTDAIGRAEVARMMESDVLFAMAWFGEGAAVTPDGEILVVGTQIRLYLASGHNGRSISLSKLSR